MDFKAGNNLLANLEEDERRESRPNLDDDDVVASVSLGEMALDDVNPEEQSASDRQLAYKLAGQYNQATLALAHYKSNNLQNVVVDDMLKVIAGAPDKDTLVQALLGAGSAASQFAPGVNLRVVDDILKKKYSPAVLGMAKKMVPSTIPVLNYLSLAEHLVVVEKLDTKVDKDGKVSFYVMDVNEPLCHHDPTTVSWSGIDAVLAYCKLVSRPIKYVTVNKIFDSILAMVLPMSIVREDLIKEDGKERKIARFSLNENAVKTLPVLSKIPMVTNVLKALILFIDDCFAKVSIMPRGQNITEFSHFLEMLTLAKVNITIPEKAAAKFHGMLDAYKAAASIMAPLEILSMEKIRECITPNFKWPFTCAPTLTEALLVLEKSRVLRNSRAAAISNAELKDAGISGYSTQVRNLSVVSKFVAAIEVFANNLPADAVLKAKAFGVTDVDAWEAAFDNKKIQVVGYYDKSLVAGAQYFDLTRSSLAAVTGPDTQMYISDVYAVNPNVAIKQDMEEAQRLYHWSVVSKLLGEKGVDNVIMKVKPTYKKNVQGGRSFDMDMWRDIRKKEFKYVCILMDGERLSNGEILILASRKYRLPHRGIDIRTDDEDKYLDAVESVLKHWCRVVIAGNIRRNYSLAYGVYNIGNPEYKSLFDASYKKWAAYMRKHRGVLLTRAEESAEEVRMQQALEYMGTDSGAYGKVEDDKTHLPRDVVEKNK